MSSLTERIKKDEPKTSTLLNITIGNRLARLLERDCITYVYARSAWMTYINARDLRCLNAIWVIILWLLCSVPARSLCKNGWEKSDYHPLSGGYICWDSTFKANWTLQANSNKLLLEATLHCMLHVLLSWHYKSSWLLFTIGTPQRSAGGYGWPKCL